jgi:hypothetical protein
MEKQVEKTELFSGPNGSKTLILDKALLEEIAKPRYILWTLLNLLRPGACKLVASQSLPASDLSGHSVQIMESITHNKPQGKYCCKCGLFPTLKKEG